VKQDYIAYAAYNLKFQTQPSTFLSEGTMRDSWMLYRARIEQIRHTVPRDWRWSWWWDTSARNNHPVPTFSVSPTLTF